MTLRIVVCHWRQSSHSSQNLLSHFIKVALEPRAVRSSFGTHFPKPVPLPVVSLGISVGRSLHVTNWMTWHLATSREKERVSHGAADTGLEGEEGGREGGGEGWVWEEAVLSPFSLPPHPPTHTPPPPPPCFHGLTSRPLESCHHQYLCALWRVLGCPECSAPELLDGSLKLRHCTYCF